jgi:hypothetical protein
MKSFKLLIKNFEGTVLGDMIVKAESIEEAQPQIDSLLESFRLRNSYGKNERWLLPEQFTTETTEQAIDQEDFETPFGTKTRFKFASEWSYEVEDVTEEKELDKLMAEAMQAQEAGRQLVAMVWALNEKKARAGQLSEAGFQTIIADTQLATIERLLKNGSLRTSRTLIIANQNPLFSASEKEMMITFLNKAIQRIYGEN